MSAFRVQANHSALGGIATLSVTSPMHIDRAPVRFTGPTGFDYASLLGVDEARRYDLAPDAREFDAELGWSRSFGSTWLSLDAIRSRSGERSAERDYQGNVRRIDHEGRKRRAR